MKSESMIFGVITGDIIRSSRLESRYFQTLLMELEEEINRRYEIEIKIEFYRGDSFQALFTKPELGLRVMMLMKSALRSQATHQAGHEKVLDARMSLGLGELSQEFGSGIRLGEMDGSAFVRSGRTLDNMKDHRQLLRITTGNKEMDDEFNAVCPLLEVISYKWSINQAEAVYLYLLNDFTQQEIGNKLGISQRSAGKRLNASHIEAIMIYNQRFKHLIEWNYNN